MTAKKKSTSDDISKKIKEFENRTKNRKVVERPEAPADAKPESTHRRFVFQLNQIGNGPIQKGFQNDGFDTHLVIVYLMELKNYLCNEISISNTKVATDAATNNAPEPIIVDPNQASEKLDIGKA